MKDDLADLEHNLPGLLERAASTITRVDRLPEHTPSGRPAQRRRFGPLGRWIVAGAAACLAVAIAIGSILVWVSGPDETVPGASTSPEASCPAQLTWAGQSYESYGPVAREPVSGASIEPATVPGCDDGNGSAKQRDVAVRAIRGVDPAVAIQTDDGAIYARASELDSELLREFTTPYPCPTGQGPIVTTATITQYQQAVAGPSRPYEVVVRLDDGTGLPFDRYSAFAVAATVDDASVSVADADIALAIRQGATVQLTLTCVDDRYRIVELFP